MIVLKRKLCTHHTGGRHGPEGASVTQVGRFGLRMSGWGRLGSDQILANRAFNRHMSRCAQALPGYPHLWLSSLAKKLYVALVGFRFVALFDSRKRHQHQF